MAAIIIKEVNRMPGYATSGDILAGQPVMLSDATTVVAWTWDGATPVLAPGVLGIALEGNVALSALSSIPTFKLQDSRALVDPTMRPSSDRPSGDTTVNSALYDIIDRGNLISVALNGGVIDLYDDGRGCPYDTAPEITAYAVNGPIYVDATLKTVTSDATVASTLIANTQIGICLAIPSTSNPVLRIKLTI